MDQRGWLNHLPAMRREVSDGKTRTLSLNRRDVHQKLTIPFFHVGLFLHRASKLDKSSWIEITQTSVCKLM